MSQVFDLRKNQAGIFYFPFSFSSQSSSPMSASRPSRQASVRASQKIAAQSSGSNKRKLTEPATRRKRPKTNDNAIRSASCAGIPQPAFSMEIWELVLKDCCPSQLSVVAQVSQYMCAVVQALPIWKTICQTADLGEPTTRGPRKTYYGVTIPRSHRICEVCFIKTKPSGSQTALPVHLKQHKKDVRLCLSCRQKHYKRHPEPYQPWEDSRLLERHGGRVGIEAEERRLRGFQETRARNLQLRQDARRAELQQHLDTMQIDYCTHWAAFDRYVVTGKPNLEATIEDVIKAAQEKQEQNARRTTLEKRLVELGLEEHTWFECTTYIQTGLPDLECTVQGVVDMVRAREERKANVAKRRKELFERLGIDDPAAIITKPVSDNLERFIGYQWMDMDALVQHARDMIDGEKKKERRRADLMRELRANGLELRQDSTLCANYIETGAHDLQDVVCRMTELGWLFRETNYGAIRHGDGSRNHFKTVAIEQYVSKRLTNMQWTNAWDDPDTFSRPPASLWTKIRAVSPYMYKEHAKQCIFEGVARNEALKEIIRNAEPDEFPSVTVEILLQAMDEGAVAIAKPPSSCQSSQPSEQELLKPSRTFSSTMKDLLGEGQFGEFIRLSRTNIIRLARKRYTVKEIPLVTKEEVVIKEKTEKEESKDLRNENR
ncbi:hypothetical protein BJV82DRAFT_384441 [Fennellomyces sp. T-0311]|nr:hypothetical protein BJV82DRAFT_384441 [Fennellomyces sp. T-0311]